MDTSHNRNAPVKIFSLSELRLPKAAAVCVWMQHKMRVKEAKEIAQTWVQEEASHLPGFVGSFYHGSVNWLSDEAVLAPSSDLDIMVVYDDPPPLKLGKFMYRGLLLEVSYLATGELGSGESILRQSHLAGSFRPQSTLLDPHGQLAALQTYVSERYAKQKWVKARCQHAESKIFANFQRLNTAVHFHDQVMSWLFGTGVTTHILLVAGLRNPTVRKRYVAARELLVDYGHADFYEILLELLGSESLTPERVAHHLKSMTNVFDEATRLASTEFFFSSDISDTGRAISIDGSAKLIDQGLHREAIFWIVATYSRCLIILHHDAPEHVQDKYTPPYRALLRDLGIGSLADMQRRSERVLSLLPQIQHVADAIIEANPGVVQN